MKATLKVVAFLAVGFLVGRMSAPGDPNLAPTFGETGLPKNCRAIIQANLDSWSIHQFTADQIFSAIRRNCGANGYSWGR